ncbi:hypothetical protein BH09ACT8_BH09ACT8_62450 [soil metagenome]
MRTHRPALCGPRSRRIRSCIAAALAAVTVAVAVAPTATAMPYGNYNMIIPDRFDFHTWIWAISPCANGTCVSVDARAQPVAKAYAYVGEAHLVDGRYTLVVDDPFGLRCDNIYYGPTIPTHDLYTWDATTLAGSMQSSFDTGCDGAPGGSFTYPFTLSRM